MKRKSPMSRPARAKLSSFFGALLAMTLLISGCAGLPTGVTPVSGFELDRYLGTWYELARLDHRFERGMSDVTATYSPRAEGGVAVLNRGYKEGDGEWGEALGKAFFVDEETVGMLEVSFFGPFYGAYNIIALDKENYQWAVIAGADRTNLWILARSPGLAKPTVDKLVAQARSLEFPVDDLIWVTHDRPQPTKAVAPASE